MVALCKLSIEPAKGKHTALESDAAYADAKKQYTPWSFKVVPYLPCKPRVTERELECWHGDHHARVYLRYIREVRFCHRGKGVPATKPCIHGVPVNDIRPSLIVRNGGVLGSGGGIHMAGTPRGSLRSPNARAGEHVPAQCQSWRDSLGLDRQTSPETLVKTVLANSKTTSHIWQCACRRGSGHSEFSLECGSATGT